jgi:hypothetical protein
MELVMKLAVMLFSLFILCNFSTVYGDSSYDWQTGNMYNSTQDGMGNTQVNGSNMQTGSTWNTTIKPNGDMNGVDSNHNSWNYDANTGYYHNLGTGETCTGKGEARSCF